MTEPILHSLAFARVMVYFAEQNGVGPEACLAGTGIDPAWFDEPDKTIRPEQEIKLVENLVENLAHVPAAGFALGLQYSLASFGIWSSAMAHSRTLRDAMKLAIRYLPLSTCYCDVAIEQAKGETYLVYDPASIPSFIREFMMARDMSASLRITQEIVQTRSPILRMEFTGARPLDADEMERQAGVPVLFDCPRNVVVLDSAMMDATLPHFNEAMWRLLDEQCRLLMARRSMDGITGQVRHHLLGALGLSASLEEVSEALSIAPRALRRKLEEEGTSYRQLVEEARRQLAEQLLRSTEMKLDEIAVHLGYADTASFTRAFRRWHGCAPGQYRAAQAG